MIAIGVPAEGEDEPRIGLTPETVKKLIKAGATVAVRSGAGERSHFSDQDYEAAGAKIAKTDAEAVGDADIVLTVRRPDPTIAKAMKKGAALIGMLDPFSDADGLDALAKSGVSLFTMELMPRISRAQSMDVLSSQSNLAGYKAVVDAAAAFERALPMMMTAAGTVPARVRHGCGRRRPSGHRHGAPPWRHRHRDRCAPCRQGAGGLARREIHRRGGRGVQAGRDIGRLRQRDV
jgi:NAD(P) transhydrogenase subunit alpha